MRKLMVAALTGAALVSGCTEARIALPAELAAGTQQLALTGIGGWRGGHFRLGGSEGRFSRRAGQARIGDFIHDGGSAAFDASGPELGGSLSGRCGFGQSAIDAGIAVISNERLSYRCAFTGTGGAPRGTMFLAEVPSGPGLVAGVSRAGEIRIGNLQVGVRAIHHSAGTSLPSGTPLGYSFSVDGRQIGAVDLNGAGPRTIFAPSAAGPERDAVLMGSLALALFWDPGS